MAAINQRDFDDPISRRLARGESLGDSGQIWLDPWGRETTPILNGGIVNPTRFQILPRTALYRFASGADGADGAMQGGWWLARKELDQLIRYAQINQHSLGYAVRLLCCVPPEWGSALNLLVTVEATGHLLAWQGLANSASAPFRLKPGMSGAAAGVTSIDAQNDIAALRVNQLFIPGTRREGAVRAMFRFVGQWQTEGAIDWLFGSGHDG